MDIEAADRGVAAQLRDNPQEVIRRYCAKHRLRQDRAVSAEMVLRHWQTETRLASQLRLSDPAKRCTQFEQAYGQFYKDLYWLNEWQEVCADNDQDIRYGFLAKLIGRATDIYEVGSGKGEMLAFLAGKGYHCVASEITAERGKKWDKGIPNLAWKSSDGVHLADYEAEASYDVVLSNQVIEHLHPDDLADHFTHVARILRPHGRYFCSTPHGFLGPADISEVFDLDEPMGFHLREYTYAELVKVAQKAGFSRIEAIYVTPQKLRGVFLIVFASKAYLRLLLWLETAVAPMPKKWRKQLFHTLLLTTLLRRDASLCLTK